MFTPNKSTRGQAVILVTLALVAMCGLIGLAVDLGWMHYIKKQAQTAADAAAMAAVQEALYRMGGVTSGAVCTGSGSTNVDCQPAPVDCSSVSSSSNLHNGCAYAARNGFTSGVNGSRQNVTIQSNNWATPPPTAPGVNSLAYWVTVRAVQTVPQLFSAVLGNTEGTVAARATAAIVSQALPGSVYVLNREGDCVSGKFSGVDCGVDIDLGGSSAISSPGPVFLSSGCNAQNSPAGCDASSGESHGSATVTAPLIASRGTAPSGWGPPAPVNGMSDGRMFQDPTTGTPQPPILANSPVRTCGVMGGQISGTVGPYNYYAYNAMTQGRPIPTGQPITMSSDTTFSAAGGCPGLLSAAGEVQTGSFPTYFFYGGLNVGMNSATFGPGQYVMVGALQSGGNPGTVFNVDTNGSLQSSGSGSGYAGNMFLMTAPGYPGLSAQMAFTEIAQVSGMLWQGNTTIMGGSKTGATLNGVMKGAAPSALDDYNGILFWQDRRNSTVEYNSDGTIANAPATAAQMAANLATATSPAMLINAAPKGLGLNGTIYQPRGAWVTFQGHGQSAGHVQLITGAIQMQGGGSITLAPPENPFLLHVCALIE